MGQKLHARVWSLRGAVAACAPNGGQAMTTAADHRKVNCTTCKAALAKLAAAR